MLMIFCYFYFLFFIYTQTLLMIRKIMMRAKRKLKEKSLPLSIGLNVILPGLGYIYMGRLILGLIGVIAISYLYLNTALIYAGVTWMMVNLLMGIDMYMMQQKRTAQITARNTRRCPNCAEIIQRQAKVCHFCKTTF